MRLTKTIAPAIWLTGIALYFLVPIDWPWTIDGKVQAVSDARLSGSTEKYKSALADLAKLSPGLAALEALEHPNFSSEKNHDEKRLIQIALNDPNSVEAAKYRLLEFMLSESPRQKSIAVIKLKELARDEDPEAIELLTGVDEVQPRNDRDRLRLARNFATSATARRALGFLLADPQAAISRYQIRDITAIERRLVELEAGNLQASSMVLLANRLITDSPSPASYKRAMDLYRDAIAHGSMRAKVEMGLALRDLPPPYRDYGQALKLLTSAAQQGSTSAAYELGETYRLAKGVPRNGLLAARYYQAAIKGGSAGAIFRIGDLYMRGDGLPRDPIQAITWFRMGAERGNQGSKRALGVAYLDGIGVEQNSDLGVKLIEEAAQAGDMSSMSRLADIYVKGRHASRDFIKAGSWALKAIAAGERDGKIVTLAASSLAQSGNASNLSRAIDLLRNSMQRGNPLARRQLATLLLSTGGQGNEAEALRLLQQGAANRDPHSLAALGAIYATGNGVEIDPERSLFYYTVAAQMNNGEGLRGLAIAYAAGFGVPKSIDRAMQYYEAAAKLGDRTAIRSLASCALEACTGVRDVAKAVQYFETAAAQGDSEASFQLATLILQGATGGGKSAAINRLLNAAAQNHVAATKLLKSLGVSPVAISGSAADVETASEIEA